MQCAIVDHTVREFYQNVSDTRGNSGFDLFVPDDIIIPAGHTVRVNFGVAAKTFTGSGFWLLPRSSLSVTPLRLANSVGLIDPQYRGGLIAAFHNTSDHEVRLVRGTRPVQIAIPSLLPFAIEWVEFLDTTTRGAGGFGSTGQAAYT